MKRLFLILSAAFIVFASGCKKDVDPTVTSQYFTVQSTDWQYDNLSSTWYVQITNYSITQDILNTGTVQCFLVATNNFTGNEYLAALPASYSGINYLCYSNIKNEEIDIQGIPAGQAPLAMKFKIVIITNK